MSRVKIELPEQFAFTTTICIRITDLNYGNHLGNQVFLELVHEARFQFLRKHNFTELNFGGTGLIMADAALEFRAEILYGDEVEIAVAVLDLTNAGFSLYYFLTAIRNGKRILAGKVKTGMTCFDYANKKVVGIPADARAILMLAMQK